MREWQKKIHEVIFEADTKTGKVFDISLLICILLSVAVVLLESVDWVSKDYGQLLYIIDWSVTILFTIEYSLRIASTGKPWKYVTSFYGIVDLLAIIPTYLAVVVTGSQSLMVIRLFRLIRIFRIFWYIKIHNW